MTSQDPLQTDFVGFHSAEDQNGAACIQIGLMSGGRPKRIAGRKKTFSKREILAENAPTKFRRHFVVVVVVVQASKAFDGKRWISETKKNARETSWTPKTHVFSRAFFRGLFSSVLEFTLDPFRDPAAQQAHDEDEAEEHADQHQEVVLVRRHRHLETINGEPLHKN
jgi:hypothetical protein